MEKRARCCRLDRLPFILVWRDSAVLAAQPCERAAERLIHRFGRRASNSYRLHESLQAALRQTVDLVNCGFNLEAKSSPCGRVGRVSLAGHSLGMRPWSRQLKYELYSTLPDARASGAKRPPKRTGAAVKVTTHRARAIELRMVEDVEELCAELQRLGFCQPHILEESQVPVIDAWPVKEPPV